MTKRESKAEIINLKGLLASDREYLRKMVERIVHATLEVAMTEPIGAERSERTPGHVSYHSGYYSRSLITRVGTLELRVPQDRQGRFSTEYQSVQTFFFRIAGSKKVSKTPLLLAFEV